MERRKFIINSALAVIGTAIAGKSVLNGKENINIKEKKMKIVVLTGSPRRHGNSNYLADQFIKGAEEAGCEVFRFDSAFKKVHPCTGCNSCGMDGDCVFDDDFSLVRDQIINADLIAFAAPMYYFGISAQLKAVIDRFYSINGKIKDAKKKAVLLMTYANSAKSDADPIILHYKTILDYLGWTDAGQVIVPGVWSAGDVKQTDAPEKAYQLGKNLI